MSLAVIKPGMLSTFQDGGRHGYQHQGIPVAGAMDPRAHRLANLLAGNAADTATLEITVAGPTLRSDDAARLDALAQQLWQLRFYLAATLSSPPRDVLRILPGPHWEAFDAASRQALLDQAFRIGAQSDRMGYRLEGPRLRLSERREMLSEATCFGTVQVPADGAPIVLMADRQTTGGYPKLAQVATVDLPSLAQAMPGQALRFALIELEQAQRLDAAREAAFAQLTGQLDALRGLLRNFQEPTP